MLWGSPVRQGNRASGFTRQADMGRKGRDDNGMNHNITTMQVEKNGVSYGQLKSALEIVLTYGIHLHESKY